MNQETCAKCGIETSDTNDLMPSSVVFYDKLLCPKCYVIELDATNDKYDKELIMTDHIVQITSLLKEVLEEIKTIKRQTKTKSGESVDSVKDLDGRSQHCSLCCIFTYLHDLVWLDNQNLACRKCYSANLAKSIINWRSNTQKCSLCSKETLNENIVWLDKQSIACKECYDNRMKV